MYQFNQRKNDGRHFPGWGFPGAQRVLLQNASSAMMYNVLSQPRPCFRASRAGAVFDH